VRLNLSAPRSDAPGEYRDVVVDGEASLTVGELATALQLPADAVAPGADPALEVARAGVLAGVRLPQGASAALPVGTVRLEVVGGPFAGEVVPLPAGSRVTVGSGPDALVRIADPLLADAHLVLDVSRDNAQSSRSVPTMIVTPASDDVVVVVDGRRIQAPTTVSPDDVIQLGASLLRIGVQPARDADVSPEGLGQVAYNRSSRIRAGSGRPSVRMPGDRPTASDRTPLPWLSAMLPVVIGVAMAFAFRQPIMLLMAAASPLMVVGNNVTSRRTAKRTGKRTVEKWRSEIDDAKERLDELSTAQRIRAWADDPGPVGLADIATTPTARLWERRSTEEDALRVRIGVGDLPLDVTLDGSRSRAPDDTPGPTVSPSPVVVDLADGVTGIAGLRAVTTGLARAVMLALATTRSPRDLRMVLLCDQASEADWSFARWLPHLDLAPQALAAIGNTSDTRLARLRELTALLESRQAARAQKSGVRFEQHVVVFLDQARAYRTLPGMVTLLEHGPEHGISVVALEDERARLPEESRVEIVVDPGQPVLARLEAIEGANPRILLDAVSTSLAERVARALSPLVHVGGVGDENLLPQAVRFVELAGIDLDDPQAIAAKWSFAPRETRALVGAGSEGEFALDLALDGPHGLVAGTTGAGKSEFLQTLVVSLAVANRPDALTFVLVDYKGGSAFADCERLPHTVGLVTNLDGRETERALESLDAELKRREHVLRDMGAKDADAAWERDPGTAAERGLARLVLVIDEFAELKAELPDFVTGLVRIARVGRSLGVHLILATQRPSGAITPEMQSNTNLRVALRVTDKADSTDVLGSGEAALISPATPGRGYARRGAGAAPAAFQTARVAGRRPGVVHQTTAAPAVMSRSWRDVGLPVVFPTKQQAQGPVDHDDTDLRALVDVVTAAAEQRGVAKNPSPWLEPLPALLTLDDVHEPVPAGAVVLGLEDVPSEQAQRPLTWSIADDSHVAFVGGARSGRTSTLRTLVAQLALAHSPADLHLYGIDYGNGGLGPMSRLPHTGAVITPLEQGRLGRFIGRLIAEIGRRQTILARDSYGDIREHRAASGAAEHERLAYVAVVLDGWERLAADLGPDDMIGFREQLIRILREGPAVGVRILLAGDRALINDKVSGFIDTRYVLPLTDREDYRTAGLPIRGLPAEIGPGRVFFGTPLREVQLAMLPGGASGEAQAATFRALVDEVRSRPGDESTPGGPRPFRVDVMPATVELDGVAELPEAAGSASTGVDVGVGGDTLSRYRVDVIGSRGFLVVGERRAGRSTALATILVQLATTGQAAAVVALRDSPVREAARRLGVPVVLDPAVDAAGLDELFAPLRAAGSGPVALIVDDVETLKDTPVEQAILARRDDFVFVVSTHVDEAGGLFRGVFPEAKKARQGILLSAANAMNGTQTFGAPLPRILQGKAAPGRAALFWDGSYVEVQVPLPGL
jgi:S-DNA-T family DNA segregation ATPase FtsK/SpoIIIE